MTQLYNRALHHFATFTACCTFLLLIAGALVTSNDAALSVPDWPLSYGTLLPPMIGGIRYEDGHRKIAGLILILTLLLAVWIGRTDRRRWMRRLGVVAFGAVIAQAVLGGLIVLLRLHYGFPVEHASLAQILFATTVAIALFTSQWWQGDVLQAEDSGWPSIHTLALTTVGFTFLQVVLGALFRHKNANIVPHLLGALLVLGMVIWTAAALRRRFGNIAAIVRVRILLHSLVGVQLLLGGAAWWSRLVTKGAPQPMPVMVTLTVAHTVVGALTLAGALLVALVSYRVAEPKREAAFERRPEGAVL
ncbi:MAG TPA: COX15/CtaA family protein [Candidatus Dormibacteraeota bacterium]|nr:COX15/CtaA family protein [Candidatus Dormibacteraeota bacterium]